MKYFISYGFFSKLQQGFGCCELGVDINSIEDVKEINKRLTEHTQDEYGEKCNCCVINYIKMSE